MIVRALPEAESELTMAANWYEDRDGGVGTRLLNAYETALSSIRERADSMPSLETPSFGRDIRRARLSRFPYMVIFELFAEEAVVLAVAHTSQRPRYWIGRRPR